MEWTDDTELGIDLELDEADDEASLRRKVAARLTVPVADLPPLVVRKRAIDARRGRVRFHLTMGPREEAPPPLGAPEPRAVAGAPVVIVGGGPAGLFCAYQLARDGIAAIVVERGKPVQARRRDLKGLTQHGVVDPDSNYCFGEGGAGTYSDGKLYTRAHKRGDVRDVLEILARHGAPPEILVDARPHIGSNKLPRVITSMRETLEAVGVHFRFGARITELVVGGGHARGVRLPGGDGLAAAEVVLATGHSARDVYALAQRAGVALEAKAFAVGVRIEHPQPLIDEIQYGRAARHPKLPAAAYRVAHTPADGRGVFSFCMCPGGWIVPAATEADGLVVNGMSLSRRDSPYANSGLVVGVEVGDVRAAVGDDVLAGLELQRRLERAAMIAGGGGLRAPATRVVDFLAGKASQDVPATSYQPGLAAVDVGEVLAASGLPLAERMRDALRVFDRQLRGYASGDAVLVGVESRTSSPVRLPRDPETLQAVGVAGLYPAGEGAGYAGGIVSAALDGVRIARAIARARGVS
ncbi:MAG: FAD-dependent oxidoreductase [Kofleriaceae bacterium]